MQSPTAVCVILLLCGNLEISGAIVYDECKPGDSIFKKSKTELIVHGPVEWEESFQVTEDMQCSLACNKHERCKSAVVNESNMCILRDVNRISPQVSFKFNPSHRYFERHSCPPSSNETFIASVNGAENCKDIYNKGHSVNGIYAIKKKNGSEYVSIRCNMVMPGGGWTMVEKRFNGNLIFDKNWATFKAGFGSLSEEYYIGNEKFHQLTENGDTRIQRYDEVRIGSEAEKYTLNLGERLITDSFITGSGADADKLKSRHDGMKFSTFDQDNDADDNINCSDPHAKAGWWYKACCNVNLHGVWSHTTPDAPGIFWRDVDVNDSGDRETIEQVYIYIR